MNTKSIYERDKGRCQYCGIKLSKKNHNDINDSTIDHIVPKSSGGGNSESNLLLCCKSCNSSKRDRTLEEFRYMKTRHKICMPHFNKSQITFLLNELGTDIIEYLNDHRFTFYFERIK